MKSKRLIILIVVCVAGLISYWGFIRNKNLTDHQAQTVGTIVNVYNLTGDKNVPKVKEPIESFKVTYNYEVDGQLFISWDIVTKEDLDYGFPIKFQEGTKIQIVYNEQDPGDNKLKCKLKLPEDKINATDNRRR